MSMNTMITEPTSVMMQDYWTIIARRKWLVISCILAGVMVAGALCVVLPKSYRSSTSILIEDQKIPDDYVKGIGGGDHPRAAYDDSATSDEPNAAEPDYR